MFYLFLHVVCSNLITHISAINNYTNVFESSQQYYEKLITKFNSTVYRLENDLFRDYNRQVRPRQHPSESITVDISVSLYQIVDVEQTRNIIKVSAYVELGWNDEYLQWNPNAYGDAEAIYVPSNKIWQPEMYVFYSIEEKVSQMMDSGLDVQVSANGRIRYFVPFTAETLCPLDVKYFPFDKQTCVLMFGAWSHTIASIEYEPRALDVNLDDFYDNQEWLLLGATLRKHYNVYPTPDGNDTYSAIVIELHMQRQSFFYVFNLVMPSALITAVALIGFHFPNSAKDGRQAKFRLGIMTLLSMAVLLLSVVTDMPKFSSHATKTKRGSFSSVPLIGIYYFTLLALISLATVTSSCFILLERYALIHQPEIPFWLVWLLIGAHDLPLRKLSSLRSTIRSRRNRATTVKRYYKNGKSKKRRYSNSPVLLHHIVGSESSVMLHRESSPLLLFSANQMQNEIHYNESSLSTSQQQSINECCITVDRSDLIGRSLVIPNRNVHRNCCLKKTSTASNTNLVCCNNNLCNNSKKGIGGNYNSSSRNKRHVSTFGTVTSIDDVSYEHDREELLEENLYAINQKQRNEDFQSEMQSMLNELSNCAWKMREELVKLNNPLTKKNVAVTWQILISRLELVSLLIYLGVMGAATYMFFNHDWY